MAETELSERRRLPRSTHPRLDRLLEEAERRYAERPDVRIRIPDPRTWDFWFWFSWHSRKEYPELRPLQFPLPPSHLIHRVVGEQATEESFVDGGIWDWRRMYLTLREGGFEFDRGARVLDFGCGCGRILRHFARYAATCSFSGTDVDDVAVAWCRENLDFATFETLPKRPPSAFADGTFDAVFAFSVFSHLPEALHRAWLEDLHRVTKPGAVVVVTVQGLRVLEKMIARDLPYDVPTAGELRRDLDRIHAEGFAFYPYAGMKFGDRENQRFYDAWDFDEYGTTFILDRYFRSRWTDLFHVVSWNPAPDDWQDYVVLRRLPGPSPRRP